MKKRSKKQFPDDDGRVIAGMNVDGMPWYIENKINNTQSTSTDSEPLSIRETFQLIFGALGAALLVGGAFGLAGLLFILFCEFAWLR